MTTVEKTAFSYTTSKKRTKVQLSNLKQILQLLEGLEPSTNLTTSSPHPMLNRRCLIRTYSAGVHIGTVVWINPENSMEVRLIDALRLWKWEGGGLSLSAVANNGIKGGRLNRTDEVFLTNAIEYIPTNPKAEATYVKFLED